MRELALILDFGSINSQQTAKIVRGLDIYCEVLPATAPAERVASRNPKAIILQRGPQFSANTPAEIPGHVMLTGLPVLDLHGLPCDAATLKKFLVTDAGFTADWGTAAFVEDAIAAIREQVGGDNVLLGMSGGIDSSVCALLLHKAVGKQLTCVFVDHGFMRKNEPREVEEIFKGQFGLNLVCVDAQDRFLAALKGVADPEQKRKIIGEEFIRVFEEEARKLGRLDYFAQGTIYPDIIESGKEGGKNVKSHHNVGGLPSRIEFKGIVEPVKLLFKDEVRKAAVHLGLPGIIARRQPFPGPGLAVRCIGELTRERLDVLRDADAIFREEILNARADAPGQYFAVLTGNRTVGVSHDARTYGHTVALRAVHTGDFIQARFARLPYDLLERVSTRITTEVPAVNRVAYDITHKPPATIEWE
ncbi:MAG: glutamine-hydrolyzing GMP synthase [Kiritimatiellaeota bacterium]|nr:glutamine-hydrolyzing GMP synthase [Kiritimatiellota bacterium]